MNSLKQSGKKIQKYPIAACGNTEHIQYSMHTCIVEANVVQKKEPNESENEKEEAFVVVVVAAAVVSSTYDLCI